MNTGKSNASVEDFGWYVLRTPLFPIEYANLVKDCQSPDDFKKLFDHSLFKEAVYLASPGLFGQFEKWLQGTIKFRKNPEKEERKLIKSLLKYWLRASYRCTPFATFAGVSDPGKVTDKTHIKIGNVTRYNRIDAEYLYITNQVLQDPNHTVVYYPNPSLYTYDSKSFRYFERIVKVNPNKPNEYLYQYHFTKIDYNEYLDALLKQSTEGITRPQMVDFLTTKNIAKPDAIEYLDDLIESQILLDNTQMSTIGEEYQENLLRQFKTGQSLLQQIKQANKLEDYQQLANQLESLVVSHYPNIKKLLPVFFQVDSNREVESNEFSRQWIPKISKIVTVLSATNPHSPLSTLHQFKTDFQNRFGDQFIPLNQALDPDNGVLYPPQKRSLRRPFGLLNLPFPTNNTPAQPTLNRWNNFVLDKYIQSVTRGEQIIKLTTHEIKEKFKEQTPSEEVHLPNTLQVVTSLISQDKLYISSIGPSPTSLLGRFCHVNSAIHQAIQTLTKHEQAVQPEVVLAEIAHNPAHPKTYNITNRPGDIRKHKILVSANPAYFKPEEVIKIQDLVIGIAGQEIILYDTQRQKRVIPKLSNAHNYTNSNYPLYQLLCDLTLQDRLVTNWDWGVLANQSFLPRVEIDGIVVTPARWIIQQPQELDNPAIPKKVLLSLSDNQLLIDRDLPISREILLDTLDKQSSIIIEEQLFEDFVVKNAHQQGFTHQLIIPLKNTLTTSLKGQFEVGNDTVHYLGKQWVYLKIYCGVLTADELLREELFNLVQLLKAKKLIQGWFFIRYQDKGGYHIRIRFKVNTLQLNLINSINEVLHHYLVAHKIKLVYDTYIPEEQRYGGKENILLCEELFYHDSEAMIQLLNTLHEEKLDEAETYMIPLAMKNVDYLLDSFGYTLSQKLELISKLATAFRQEFKVGKTFKKALAKSHRTLDILKPLDTLYDIILQQRTEASREVIQQIHQNIAQGTCKTPLAQLFSSISHMSLNRLFLEKPREQEMVTYDFLAMQYKAQVARQKNK